MDRASDLQLEIVGSNLGSGRNCQRGGVINEHSLYLQYHDWGETLEQGTEPPTAPRTAAALADTAPGVCSQCVCSLLCVCTWMG